MIEEVYKELTQSGVLGALLVLAIMGIVYLFQALIKEKDKAIEKQSQTNVVLKAVNDTMGQLLVEIERDPYESKREKKVKRS